MTDRELLQQALDTLRHLCLHSRAVQGYDGEQVQSGIDALKARLAQTEPDDGYCQACEGNYCTAKDGCVARDNPPQREWQGLTDEEIEDCLEMSIYGTCRAVEAALKAKNT